jgi:hypothetical protein
MSGFFQTYIATRSRIFSSRDSWDSIPAFQKFVTNDMLLFTHQGKAINLQSSILGSPFYLANAQFVSSNRLAAARVQFMLLLLFLTLTFGINYLIKATVLFNWGLTVPGSALPSYDGGRSLSDASCHQRKTINSCFFGTTAFSVRREETRFACYPLQFTKRHTFSFVLTVPGYSQSALLYYDAAR